VTPPRVVHVVVAGEIGGAERMLVTLATHPTATGADHAVALVTPNERLARTLRDAGLRVHDRGRVREGPLPFLWRSFGPSDVEWVAGVLTGEHASIAHLHTFASQVLGTRAAARTRTRVLRTEHSTRAFEDPTCWPFSKWSLARTDASVAISQHVCRAVAARAPWAASRTRVVYNGVDTERFAPRQVTPPDAFTFALVGRLEARKGVDLGIEALARVPGARLEVIGEGGERASLEARVARLGIERRVRFDGYLEDTRDAIARSDALLCSSREEGLGIALLEGMAMARPVVGFAVGGVPEIVEEGRSGLLASAGDVGALAERMREAVNARARMSSMGATARAAVAERFSLQSMCEGYSRVYAELTS